MEDKSWYKSKTVWAAILFFLVALLKANEGNIAWLASVNIPWEVLQAALASLGLYGVRDAVGNW